MFHSIYLHKHTHTNTHKDTVSSLFLEVKANQKRGDSADSVHVRKEKKGGNLLVLFRLCSRV